jgi:hypothetical protein
VSAGFGLGILAGQFPVRFHLGQQGMGFIRAVHDPRPVNVPRRDALGIVRQQFQDFIQLGAASRVAPTGKDAKLFTSKPISKRNCPCCRG